MLVFETVRISMNYAGGRYATWRLVILLDIGIFCLTISEP